jgi:hypothetical protein
MGSHWFELTRLRQTPPVHDNGTDFRPERVIQRIRYLALEHHWRIGGQRKQRISIGPAPDRGVIAFNTPPARRQRRMIERHSHDLRTRPRGQSGHDDPQTAAVLDPLPQIAWLYPKPALRPRLSLRSARADLVRSPDQWSGRGWEALGWLIVGTGGLRLLSERALRLRRPVR